MSITYNRPGHIAALYDRKTRGDASALNRVLASSDGLFFNHNGLVTSDELDLLAKRSEAERLALLHHMEIDLVKVGQRHLGPIGPGSVVLDAGCGAGGGAILMHEDYGCAVEGVTLSPEQARFATEAAAARGIGGYVRFSVGDMAEYCADHGPYEAIWACESTEHAYDLKHLFGAFHDALKPGARAVVIAWCAGIGLEAEAVKLRVDEHYLTDISTPAEYRRAANAAGLVVAGEVDLTQMCVPYWIERARSEDKTGAETFMVPGFASRLLTYNLFVLEAA